MVYHMRVSIFKRKPEGHHEDEDKDTYEQSKRIKQYGATGDMTSPPQLNKSSSSQKHILCSRCADLNLEALLLISESPLQRIDRFSTTKSVNWKYLGEVEGRAFKSCTLCRLLAANLFFPDSSSKHGRHNDDPYDLYVFSSNKIDDLGWSLIDAIMIPAGSVYRNDFTCFVPQPNGASAVRTSKKNLVDYEIFKGWLNLCQQDHENICGDVKLGPVPFLKLIDCETRALVPGSDHSYVALSYTWGSIDSGKDFMESLPDGLPCTIEDAITVTLKLGFRYLWIDRYCINQQRRDEVFEQIQKMDIIYQNSEFTIIAAAGQDPLYGLPGVSRRDRSPQAPTKISEHSTLTSLENPQHLLRGSRWMSRGWTYQEALLSRRRLVFTDRQVYYECYSMFCCEALNFPLQGLLANFQNPFKKPFLPDGQIGVFPKGIGSREKDIVDRIGEYSKKSLTNPSDILNGILGVMRSFEIRYSVRQYFGVPILRTSGRRQSFTSKNFFLGLCWELRRPTPPKRPLRSDRDFAWSKSSRRCGFPSWSWTGWFGPVSWISSWNLNHVDANTTIRIELRDGQILKWHTFQRCYNKLHHESQLSCFIHVAAFTIEVKIIGYVDLGYEGIRCKARIDIADGGYLDWGFDANTERSLQDETCTAILLAHDDDGQYIVMVVCKKENVMERVGFGWIDEDSYNRYSSDGSKCDPLGLPSPTPPLVKSWNEIRLG